VIRRHSPLPVGHHRGVDVTFSVRDDGQVDAHLGEDWRIFQDALDDSISSLPPRGAVGNGPSTYWVDHAEEGARTAHRHRDERPFTSGNITLLRVVGDAVVATYDFSDDEQSQAMPLDDFLALLAGWRSRILDSASHARAPLPETYRRNPAR
jgi:hypothetical protein